MAKGRELIPKIRRGLEDFLIKEEGLAPSRAVLGLGMVEKLLKQWGINVTRRSLEYYLHHLKHQGLLKLEKTRLGRGFSQRIELNL